MDPLVEKIYRGGTPELEEVVAAWGERFELLHRLADTPQDPGWHAEGDVFVHTSMVLEETYRRLEDFEPGSQRRLALVLGAIFHDIAKPLTTRERVVDGVERIVAPRHARRGASYLAYRLLELGLAREFVHETLALVAYHHRPKHMVLDDRPARRYRHLARLVDIELLYHLEQADMRGRRCDDRAEQIELVELFGLFARDHGVFGPRRAPEQLYEGWREHIDDALADLTPEVRRSVFERAVREAEAGIIYTPQEAVARSYGYREAFADLVVLCGPSGSGKTTWARRHLPGHHVVSMDEIRSELTGDVTDHSREGEVRQLAKERLKDHLRHHRRVVWDASNHRRDFRGLPLRLGFDYDARTTLVVFQMRPETFARRNRERERTVPTSVLDRQIESLQWPELDEAHRVLFVGEDGEAVEPPSLGDGG
jgi:predicted kinase